MDIVTRLRELSDAVTKGPETVAREFTMRVPAEPDRDADLVLSHAAAELERMRRVAWGVVHNAQNGRRSANRWVHVKNATGLGRGSSIDLCREFGLDPDEQVGTCMV
jgi:hypothetical protein